MLLDDANDSFFSCSSSASADDDYASALDSDDDIVLLRDKLAATFAGCAKNLNVVHINAQSIPSHYSDILSSFDCNVIDVILVSETFLKPTLPSKRYELPGYRLIRNDRVGKGCGGVGIYLRSDIPHTIVEKSPNQYTSNSAEYLFVEISFRHSKVLLGVFYPPSCHVDYFSTFESALTNFSSLYEHILILGDFNTCLMKDDHRARRLLSILSSVNMHALPLSATHNQPHCTPSLLDLIITSQLERVATHGQVTAPFSYHDLIFLSYKIRCPRRKPQYLLMRSFKNIEIEALKLEVSNTDWSTVFTASDIDDKIEAFNKILLSLYDRHAPLKRVKVRHPPAPWLTPDIKDAMSKRDKAKRRYKRHSTDTNHVAYKTLRNRCSKMCRDAKRRHIHKSLEKANPSQTWKFLKSLGIGKSSADPEFNFDLNSLNSHFSRPPYVLSNQVKCSTLDYLSSVPKPSCSPFSFLEVAVGDVIKILLSISTNAIGSDGICIKMIRLILSDLAPVVTHLVNFSLSSNKFPSAWKKANVIPLPKSSNPTTLSQFRPISILPVLSKVLENVVHKQLSDFLDDHRLLTPFQSGFRRGHSTVSALVKVSDDIRLAMERKFVTVLVLLDFSSAFNSVDFDILLGILFSLNASPTAISWFDSYLRGRSQCVRHEDSFSDWCDLGAGVPQGGVLSPLLFCVFINTITNVISSNFHLYADDLQIYSHFPADDIVEQIELINRDLVSISEWAKSFGLLVNPSKSQALIVGNTYHHNTIDRGPMPAVVYDDVKIPYTDCAKNLGVLFDSRLSWEKHVNLISQRVFATFHSLRHLQNILPLETRITLAQSLLLPLLDYGDVCFLDATEVLLNKLERLQNVCIRFIFGLRKFDHVSEFRAKLKWLPIRRRHDLHVLSFLYSVLFNPSYPSYLRERFSFCARGASNRRAQQLILNHPPNTSSKYGGSFTVQAVRLWNGLPCHIRASETLSTFKNKVKEHYLSCV